MKYRELDEIVKSVNKKLRADDPRLANSVNVLHGDGTFMHFESAFVVQAYGVPDSWTEGDGLWNIIFTEHHGYFIYDSSDARVTMHGDVVIDHVTCNPKWNGKGLLVGDVYKDTDLC